MRRGTASALGAGLAAALVAGCGVQSATSAGPAGDAASTTAGASQATTPGPLVTLHRVGGLPGIRDDLVIRADGLARLSTRDGTSSGCQLARDLLRRARAVPWAQLGAGAAGPGSDGGGADRLDTFRYVIEAGGHRRIIDPGPGLPGQLAEATGTAAVLLQAARAARTSRPSGCTPA